MSLPYIVSPLESHLSVTKKTMNKYELLKNLWEEKLFDYIGDQFKELKRYRNLANKASERRFNTSAYESRAKITSLNAKSERMFELRDSVKDDLKVAIEVYYDTFYIW